MLTIDVVTILLNIRCISFSTCGIRTVVFLNKKMPLVRLPPSSKSQGHGSTVALNRHKWVTLMGPLAQLEPRPSPGSAAFQKLGCLR
jgi:hypothetical protein